MISNIFNFILFADTIEHAINPKKTLQEVDRVLRSSGFIIVSAPIESMTFYSKFIHPILLKIERKIKKPTFRKRSFNAFLHAFDLTSFKRLVIASGFKIVSSNFDQPRIDYPFRRFLEKKLNIERSSYGVILARKSQR